jgi:hypothetical protein
LERFYSRILYVQVYVFSSASEYRRDDVLRVDSSWHGDYESDSESLDNDMDDPLRSEIA